ncbi:flagellar hook-length control protein FliK [Massilia endophytica]|uniref:flagellar hook-length control protein FliK n=1 Tax=Massilia endophytica TaxID=2899220 RepID=UPI001E50D8C7|nr:flagellar hook-length control protein FliK [Massilia endophytica]UGQ45206.1 flagellar hook-length control protein FliK [Massilia endophytica]
MVSRLDAPAVRPLTPAGPILSSVDPRQAAFQRALAPLVGQSLAAEVLSKMDDGSYLVRIANTNARMVLPAGTQVGAEVPMTVLAAQPRPMFQIGGQPVQAAAAQEAPPLPQGAPGLPDTDSLPSQAAPRPTPQPQSGQPAPLPTPAPGAALPPGSLPAPAMPPGLPQAAAPAQPGQPAPAQGANGAAAPAPDLPDAGLPGVPSRPLSPGAALLSKAPLTPAEQLPQLDHTTPQASLSPAARAIASALSTAYTAPGVPVTINGKAPLLQGGSPDPEQIEGQLRRALGDSGLFYESHVAEWAQGKRPLQDLAREPQMQRFAQAAAQSASEAAAKAQGGPDLSGAQLINQQLHTQELARVQWQGEAWPGQPMHWELRRDEAEQQQPGEDGGPPEPVWRSGLRFSFPLLGKLAANVTLTGGQVHLQVEAGSEETAATLRAWAGQLQQALEAAGSPLSSLSIQAEGGGDGE